jgi:hypothetical protein
MANFTSLPLAKRPRAGHLLNASLRRLVTAALAVPDHRRSLVVSDGEPVAILVADADGVAISWTGRELVGLPVRFEGIEAARLALEAAGGRSVRLTPLSCG